MHAFTSARYTVPLGHHSYPMDKYRLVPERLLAESTLTPGEIVEPEAATLDDVLRVHTPEYVHAFINGSLERKALLRIGLPWSQALVQRAFAVLGGTLGAARTALKDGAAANLAGGTHHAFADHGEGYCIFNDLVVTLRRLRAEGLAKRFLIIDLDVHQGNGTAALCGEDTDTFTFSVHGENNYPARKERSSWDIALPDGTSDGHYLDILAQALSQLLERFTPEMVFYQAGVDVLAGDRFGKLELTMEGVGERDRLVCEFACRAGLPLVITLGGGYARDINRIVAAHCQTVRMATR
ncbi:MAG TPA: histone deacetylase [Candidatus Binatia bacterium]|jgi:acetoin utilization deacetylase AcuC-like enzyme|nr:histone deacetylase [Candidatus Binatia bacterium]